MDGIPDMRDDGQIAQSPPPSDAEVRAVAELLEASPEKLTSLKLPGPLPFAESILTVLPGALPELPSFAAPERFTIQWNERGQMHDSLAARYDSKDGSVVIVSHESGPEVFLMALDHAAAATTVIAGGYALLRHFGKFGRSDGSLRRRITIRRRWYDEEGRLTHDERVDLDEADEDGTA